MQSISEIKEILSNCSMETLPEQMKQFDEDSRKGVQTALASFRKKYEKYQQELERFRGRVADAGLRELFQDR